MTRAKKDIPQLQPCVELKIPIDRLLLRLLYAHFFGQPLYNAEEGS
jgi:hypothetical protein